MVSMCLMTFQTRNTAELSFTCNLYDINVNFPPVHETHSSEYSSSCLSSDKKKLNTDTRENNFPVWEIDLLNSVN